MNSSNILTDDNIAPRCARHDISAVVEEVYIVQVIYFYELQIVLKWLKWWLIFYSQNFHFILSKWQILNNIMYCLLFRFEQCIAFYKLIIIYLENHSVKSSLSLWRWISLSLWNVLSYTLQIRFSNLCQKNIYWWFT